MLRKYFEKVRFHENERQAAISRDAWLDESYVSRLISGEPAPPSRDALTLLGARGWNWQSMSSTSSRWRLSIGRWSFPQAFVNGFA